MLKLQASGLRWIWIVFLVLAIDRYSKWWAVNHLTFSEPLSLLPFFNLTLAFNTGAAFSFLHNASGWQTILLPLIAISVSIGIIYWLIKLPAREWFLNSALTLIMGGALGNVWDRLLYGYVIDFFDFHLGAWHFAIFNVADSAVCIGSFMLILHWLRHPN